MRIPKTILNSLPPLYSTDGVPAADKQMLARFYCPANGWSYYACEASPFEGGGTEFFGWVDGFDQEWGLFYSVEFDSVPGQIIFDEDFRPMPFPCVELLHRTLGHIGKMQDLAVSG